MTEEFLQLKANIKTNKIDNITMNINELIVNKTKITPELIDILEKYHKNQTDINELVENILFISKKYREVKKMPKRGVYTTQIDFE